MFYNEEEYNLTEKEKEVISNELEELLNNPNISINTNTIKNAFVKYKYMYIGTRIELEWYKIAEHIIKVLRSKIEKGKK